MNFRRKHTPREPGFQMAPMVDVIFQLMMFFVVSQLFAQWETEIDIKLPTAQTGKMPGRLPGEIILNILKDGTVVVNRQPLDEAGLRELLGRIVTLFAGQPVLIRADKATAYEHIIWILDLCRQSDIWNISFATAVSEESAAGG